MRIVLAFNLFLSFNVSAKTLHDVDYRFDRDKLASTKSTFTFFRTFVDYFYVVTKGNLDLLPGIGAPKTGGWCVGDAHPENFGALLLQNDTSIFSVNDLDDAGPCPLAMDLSRFLIASTFANAAADLPKILQSYQKGLDQNLDCPGQAVDELLAKSQRRGRTSKDDEIVGNQLNKDKGEEPVDTATRARLHDLLKPLIGDFTMLDAVTYAKDHGGSEGIRRYRLLIKNDSDKLILELKGQVAPAISIVATVPVPATKERISQTLLVEQGSLTSQYYGVITFEGADYFVRPRFRGNVGVKLADYSPKETEDLLECEANRLGLIHEHSLANNSSYREEIKTNGTSLLQDVKSLAVFFTKKYQSLGQQTKDTIPPL